MERNRITESIIGAAIEVHRALGPGLLESAYEECLPIHEAQLLTYLKLQLQRPGPEGRHPKDDSMTSLCPLCLCGETRFT